MKSPGRNSAASIALLRRSKRGTGAGIEGPRGYRCQWLCSQANTGHASPQAVGGLYVGYCIFQPGLGTLWALGSVGVGSQNWEEGKAVMGGARPPAHGELVALVVPLESPAELLL